MTDPVDGCLRRARYLIHDRAPLSTRVLGEILEGGSVQPIRLPPKSPNLNAYAERFVRSMKEECLSRVVPLGEGYLRFLVGEDVDHSHRERNHQGLDNQLLQRPPPPVSLAADVQRRERLGRLLNFYHREAAGAVGRLNAPYGVGIVAGHVRFMHQSRAGWRTRSSATRPSSAMAFAPGVQPGRGVRSSSAVRS